MAPSWRRADVPARKNDRDGSELRGSIAVPRMAGIGRNLPVRRGFDEGRLTTRPGGSHRLPMTSGFAPKPAVRLSWVEERLALVDTGSFPGRVVHPMS
jgi:hypothetical protein